MVSVRRFWIGAAAILLAAFALRAHRLDWQALWWDEGLTLFFARLNFADNAEYAVRLADTNPPFYRMILGGWLALAGSSAFAARAFSVIAGVVAVAATTRLGRALLGAKEALLAGGLAAASPALIYYSREAKTYSLVAACGTLSIVLWLRLLQKSLTSNPPHWSRPGLWLAYGLTLAVPLGSHYIAIFLIAVQAGWMMIMAYALTAKRSRQEPPENEFSGSGKWKSAESRLGTRGEPASPGFHPTQPGDTTARHRLLYFFATLALVFAAQVPFWLLTYAGTGAAVRGETGVFEGLHGPGEFFGAHLLEFGIGPEAGTEGAKGTQGNGSFWSGVPGRAGVSWAGATALALLALAGLVTMPALLRVPSFPYIRYFPSFFCLSLILLPVLAGFALNLYHEFFFPRFLLYSVPSFLLLAAAGLAGLFRRPHMSRVAGIALVAMIAAAWAWRLAGYYAGPGAAASAEDWRPVAAAMRGHTQPSDAAVYVWGWMPGYLHAYLPPSPEPQYYLGFYTPESLAPELAAIAVRHSRIWLLDYRIDQFDVRNAAGRWLGEHGALAYAGWPGGGNAHVALFLPADRLPDPDTGSPQSAAFVNGLQLRWSPVYVQLTPGDAIGVGLDWTAPPQAVPRRFTVFLHGLAADGSLAFGRDSEPVNGLRPVDTWAAGERVRDWRAALLPPDLAAGNYTLAIGLYDTLTAERVPTRDGRTAVPIGIVAIH